MTAAASQSCYDFGRIMESVSGGRGAAHGHRILMVTPRYFPLIGGTEIHVRETSRRLAERGCEIGILTTDTTGKLASSERVADVRVTRVRAWPANSDLRFAPGVPAEIGRGGWDLVHIQGYHTLVAPLAMAAAIRAGVPFVVTFHSGGHSSRLRQMLRAPQRLALQPLVRKAAQLIGVSRFEADFFSRSMGIPRERFEVVPNGGELPRPAPEVASPMDSPLIVSIGRLERYKGHQRAIEAMPYVLRRFPDSRLRIAGDGPYLGELLRLVDRLDLTGRVDIEPVPSGDRAAMADLLARAALVVLFSDYEAHPVAIMEALSFGKKIVVSDSSGLAEMAEYRGARGVSPRARSAERARAMINSLEDASRLEPIDLPTWDKCADRLLAIYQRVLGARVARPVAQA